MLQALLVTILTLALLVAFLVLSAVIGRRLFGTEAPVDHARRITTKDHVGLRLVRIDPRTSPRKHPVLLVHGIAANSANLNLDPDDSLAFSLADAGFETWLIDLRTTRYTTAEGRPQADLETLTRQDLEAAISEVLRASGAPALHLLGFSMGGLITTLRVALGPRTGLRTVTLIGAPMILRSMIWFGVGRTAGRALLAGTLPTRWLAQPFWWLAGVIHFWPMTLVANSRDLPRTVMRRAVFRLLENIPNTLLADFEKLVGQRHAAMAEDSCLAEAPCPLLCIAGTADGLAPPESASLAYDHWGHSDKTMVVLGPDTAGRPFGHADLVLGPHARKHVDHRVTEWITARDQPGES
ncbi:MAG: pimeloyl-ACP methyl ester carboxylesterase [Myxococcota bacterium]